MPVTDHPEPDNTANTTVRAPTVTPIPPGTLIPRPDGRGALKHGNPGNKGGIGRPPAEVKSRSRLLYERVLKQLERQMDDVEESGKPMRSAELVNIGSLAAKYGDLATESEQGNVQLTVVRVDAPQQGSE